MSFSDDEKTFEHDSYAMVGFSRCTGNPGRLFGSSMSNHGTFITLRVARAMRRHSLGRDWYHAESTPLIEVVLSSAQFAELLTTMNIGNGVPCTLRSLHGNVIAMPPDELLEVEQVRTDFKEKVRVVSAKLEGYRAQILAIVNKGSALTKKDRADIDMAMKMIVQDVHSNIPFWLEQFNEATQKVVTAAKAEVDSFLTHAMMAAGQQALAAGESPFRETPQLTSDDAKKDGAER